MAASSSAASANQLALMESLASTMVPMEMASSRGRHVGGRRTRWAAARTLIVGEDELLEPGKSNYAPKVKWGPKDKRPFLPPPFLELPAGMSPLQIEQFLREQRLEELNKKLLLGELELGDPDLRSVSPPPVYDQEGTRTNTREMRVKAAMASEQQRLVETMSKKVPGFISPAEFKPVKRIRRILIPQSQFPEYNFMGLIIGPRGCNHKRLETESGAQISIRGRGTQKEGKRSDHQTSEEAAMPQHVHISADSEEKLERAVALIEPLLDPSHPIHEEFKRRGLEQLAVVNGIGAGGPSTGGVLSRSDLQCSICQAMGHLAYACPEAQYDTYKMADVKCLLCGDRGHVTMDCKIAVQQGLTPDYIRAMEAQFRAAAAATAAPGGGVFQGGETASQIAQMLRELGIDTGRQ